MAENVEVKARISNWKRQCGLAERLSGNPPEIVHQRDIFYDTKAGRLKLRFLSPHRGELILYHRPDETGPKRSDYTIHHTGDPSVLHSILESSMGAIGTIAKRRLVYHAGQTRIHLDEVEGLGRFIELEVVLREGRDEKEGAGIARDFMKRLEIRDEDLIDKAYIDLWLLSRGRKAETCVF